MKQRMKQEMKKTGDWVNVEQIAELARLSVPEEERDSLARDMEVLIAFADGILSAEDGEWESDDRFDFEVAPLRGDLPEPPMDRQALLAAAKTTRDGFVTVPRVVED